MLLSGLWGSGQGGGAGLATCRHATRGASRPSGPSRHHDLVRRRAVSQNRVRTHGVVVAPPAFDNDAGLLDSEEGLAVERFVAKPCVEALDVANLTSAAGSDVGGLGAYRGEPTAFATHSGPLSERIYPGPRARSTARPVAG